MSKTRELIIGVSTAVLLLSLNVQAANNKVIYGEDDRVSASESDNEAFVELSRSTAVQIENNKLSTEEGSDVVTIKGQALKDSFIKVCEDEKFADTITAGNCSGFLVAPDLLVTAGHCMKPSMWNPDKNPCAEYQWVFNFNTAHMNSSTEAVVSKSDVYKCKEVVSSALSSSSKNDYALVRLDRAVEGREPLKFRKEGQVEEGAPLVVIGHPSGLPTMIADGANVRKNVSPFYFNANLDTFGGNSGSAVFNVDTGEIEGILVRGERDYQTDPDLGCKRVFKCENDTCRGEDVTRITVIPELAPGMTPDEPVAPTFDFNNILGEVDNPFSINP
ncbi:MAG: trypsin-like peptidase domain-containing protein [Bacteriovoracaceae bacterium]|nr:trypsin-like peptidase domain-containing protein [Bacteriovoracaceae bacterium]